jgi:hypothetical protein
MSKIAWERLNRRQNSLGASCGALKFVHVQQSGARLTGQDLNAAKLLGIDRRFYAGMVGP